MPWATPSDTGGEPVSSYIATASPGGATCSTTGETSCTLTGLTNGTAYTFTVTAQNSAGTSQPSNPSSPTTPVGRPSAPSSVRLNADGGFTFEVDPNGSVIAGYTIEYRETSAMGTRSLKAVADSRFFEPLIVSRIVGGGWASIGDFPYQVYLKLTLHR